jgi:hypothetical protein
MSRDEDKQFRITPWPLVVQSPPTVAVRPLVGVCDIICDFWPEEEKAWWHLGDAEDRFDLVGPLRDEDHEEEVRLLIDPAYSAAHPGSENALIRCADELETQPVLIIGSAPVALVAIPDELFLRGFLDVDGSDAGSVIAFVDRWGPLTDPVDPLPLPSDVLGLIPRAWQRYADGIAEDERRRPPLHPDLERLLREGASAEQYAQRSRELKLVGQLAVAAAAASHPLDAVADLPMKATTHLRLDALDNAPEVPGYEGGEQSLTYGEADEKILVSGYSLERQMYMVRLYQAIFETWIRIDPDRDLGVKRMHRAPRSELIAPWAKRALPLPTSCFELVMTAQLFLNEMTSSSGPRIELAHPTLEEKGGAYGRPVPRILTALCLQLLAWLSEGVPARRCANETCQQWFTHQQGRSWAGQYRATGVLYCSSSCARAQAQREYRRRRRRNRR